MVLMSSGVLCRSIARLIDINTYILKLTMDIQDTSITIHKINPKEACIEVVAKASGVKNALLLLGLSLALHSRHMDILEVLNELIL